MCQEKTEKDPVYTRRQGLLELKVQWENGLLQVAAVRQESGETEMRGLMKLQSPVSRVEVGGGYLQAGCCRAKGRREGSQWRIGRLLRLVYLVPAWQSLVDSLSRYQRRHKEWDGIEEKTGRVYNVKIPISTTLKVLTEDKVRALPQYIRDRIKTAVFSRTLNTKMEKAKNLSRWFALITNLALHYYEQ